MVPLAYTPLAEIQDKAATPGGSELTQIKRHRGEELRGGQKGR
jgi:hypothetical protein